MVRSLPGDSTQPRGNGVQAPSTTIDGVVTVDGSLVSSSTNVDGNVTIAGTTTTTGVTHTDGWADYGTTHVDGSMYINATPGVGGATFALNPGSGFFLGPPSAVTGGSVTLEGNISMGSVALGQAYGMSSTDTNITIYAGGAGSFQSYPTSALNLNPGSNIQIINFGTTGTVTASCAIPIICPITVAAGTTYTPTLGITTALGDVSWTAGTDFTILGTTTSGGSGVVISLINSKMVISTPGAGTNLSMTAADGEPTTVVTSSPQYPAQVATTGLVSVMGGPHPGESVNATVAVLGTFTAVDHAANGGTFTNQGGLTIQGDLVSSGYQQFSGSLALGPYFQVTTAAGGNMTTIGATSIDTTVNLTGTTVAQGTLTLLGNLTQNATLVHLQGDVSLSGSLDAVGVLGTSGTTIYGGNLSSSGNISMPNAFLDGSFQLTRGTFEGVGTTDLVGVADSTGTVSVNATTYNVTGDSSLDGRVHVNGTISSIGNTYLATAPQGSLHLTATINMGGVAVVQGSVLTQGTAFANGTSTFTGTTVTFPSGLRVAGSVVSQGNTTVTGTTLFTGAVTTTGDSRFPGMALAGTFGLSATGGSVTSVGVSYVGGNVSLAGVLTIDQGTFHEVGESVIVGDLTMTGTVTVTGTSTLTTSSGTLLYLWGDIHLAGAAHIDGTVNTSGDVTISGAASLGPDGVNITGSLSANGSVVSEGQITLSGLADFDGPVATQGDTDLPGIQVAGNFSMSTGTFALDGLVQLHGQTVSLGTVTANGTGYYVTGSSRIEGSTSASGSMRIVGDSTTVGYVNIGAGSVFGTFMQIRGTLDTGGLALTGLVTLPNDEVTFAQGANISGSISIHGTLTGQGSSASFQGESWVNGTVTSGGTPQVQGPIVATVLGSPFAFTLGPEFYLFLGGLVAAFLAAVVEALRVGLKHRRPFTSAQQNAVRPLLPEALASAGLMVAGGLAGTIIGYSLGESLQSPANAGEAGQVSFGLWIGGILMVLGVVLWAVHRGRYRRARRGAEVRPLDTWPAPEAIGWDAPAALPPGQEAQERPWAESEPVSPGPPSP